MYFLCVTGIKYSRLEKRGKGRIQEVVGKYTAELQIFNKGWIHV